MSWPRQSLPPRSARTSRLTTVKGACNSRHRASITGRADCATVTAREVGLMMPAFSRAMRDTVFPKCSVCSRSTRVTTETRPSTIFVASIRPPIPTSITAMSTCRSWKYSKAIAVVTSKNVGWSIARAAVIARIAGCIPDQRRKTSSSVIGVRFTWIRSLKVARSRTEESNEAHTYISRMAIFHRMHPAERLRGRKSPKLHGKTIVLGVTGSIAAVETVKLAHELIRHGADVHAVLTRSALEIVHPNALEYATGHAVVTAITGSMEYLEMCGRDGKADLLLIAPCTANTMGKIAQGI